MGVVPLPKKVALTVDLEEWTVPEDFRGRQVPENVKLQVSCDGLSRLLSILGQEEVKATFFVTAYFAQRNRSILRSILRSGHEIANHGLEHTRKSTQTLKEKLEEITKSTSAIEDCVGTRPLGYREPYFAIEKSTLRFLIRLGYLYDSSILGTWLPGKLQWISFPSSTFVWKCPENQGKLIELPVSVWSRLRIPIGWWWFRKNFGDSILSGTGNSLFRFVQPFITNIHAWELAELPKSYDMPFHIRHNCGEKSAKQILRLISRVKDSRGKFVLMKNLALEFLAGQSIS